MRGKFITFEGPEGGGKSTQVQKLADWLRRKGKTVVVTREPGGTRLAELIRGLVRDEMDDPPVTRCEVLLFLASRAQVVSQVIRPALARGDWVVCDRFSDSTFAYQGFGRGIDVQLLKNFNDFVTEGLVPDMTFLLDVPPEVSRERLAARQAATAAAGDRIETAGVMFHRRLREGFFELAHAEPKRFVVIDAVQSIEKVAAAVQSAAARLLDKVAAQPQEHRS